MTVVEVGGGALEGISAVLRTFASRLRSAQHRMATIRQAASGAGLDVTGFVIHSPGPGPANPSTLSARGPVTPDVVHAHNAAVEAFEAHQRKIRAYNTAARDTRAVQGDVQADSTQLSDAYRGLQGANWLTNGGDLMGGLGGGAAEFHASALRGTADELGRTARQYLEIARNADPAVVGRARFYDDLDAATRDVRRFDDLARHADDPDSAARRIPLKLGGALAIAGIGYDIATGKDPVEATVSGAAGFAASVGTGALIGTAIGGPVGTAVGAFVGAGVGIFTSGAVDWLFENGPDVGTAVEAGVDAVTDTAEAVGDVAGGAIDAIGGPF